MSKRKFIVLTDKGIASQGYKNEEIVAMLMEAMLEAWNDTKGHVNIVEAGKRIIDLLMEMDEEEDDIYAVLDRLIGDDDDAED